MHCFCHGASGRLFFGQNEGRRLSANDWFLEGIVYTESAPGAWATRGDLSTEDTGLV